MALIHGSIDRFIPDNRDFCQSVCAPLQCSDSPMRGADTSPRRLDIICTLNSIHTITTHRVLDHLRSILVRICTHVSWMAAPSAARSLIPCTCAVRRVPLRAASNLRKSFNPSYSLSSVNMWIIHLCGIVGVGVHLNRINRKKEYSSNNLHLTTVHSPKSYIISLLLSGPFN